MGLAITTLDSHDILLQINNAAVPDVGPLTAVKAEWLVGHLLMAGLAVLDGQPAGLVVVLSDKCGYPSDYYRWFTVRYENFMYVDRIVVAHWARGRGVAQALYSEIDRLAHELNVAIVSDVYCEPPNTPAIHIPFSLSQIIRSLSVSLRSLSSSVVNLLSFGRNCTFTSPPFILSASNACNGCPNSCKT